MVDYLDDEVTGNAFCSLSCCVVPVRFGGAKHFVVLNLQFTVRNKKITRPTGGWM